MCICPPPRRTRILDVEDEVRLGESMCEHLTGKRFTTALEPRGDAAVPRIVQGPWDLIVLALLLPGLDGREVCRRVRAHFAGGILTLTASIWVT